MSKKPRIGYTTGVFDMFHVGHLRILEQAKAQCDFLVVGVSSDALVAQYKKKTPIIPLQDRKTIIEAVRHVDMVVVQKHRDKVKAWEEIRFDVMFVGDDWKGNRVFQEAEKVLNGHGVEIVFFPYTKHVSSTQLTEVLNQIDADTRI
ncbi:adenylyltransferase/cytidyltransferase family protein [Qipengyuania sp. CAU 1752]